MLIQELNLYNFRCFFNYKISFSKGVNILTGKNASGKTSILESIYYLSLTKSFKTSDETALIRENESEMSIIGSFLKENAITTYKIIRNPKGKQISKNDFKFTKISDYIGENLVVAFSNSDMINLVGSPRDRRKIIEPIICQISKVYTSDCNYYKKILNERNALLKRLIFEKSDSLQNVLKTIDYQLINSAKKIIKKRKEFISKVNKKIDTFHQKISNGFETLQIQYIPSVDEEFIEEKMMDNLSEDLKKGTTNLGPHKDDYVFIINNKNISLYGSQGQQRSALISAKMSFVELLKEAKNDFPILLLDDVLSELDSERQNNLFKTIDENVQTFVSSSTLSELNENIKNNANIITLGKEM